MSDLATAPVGKQSIIDLRAGAILRQQHHKGKPARYHGCPAWFLLATIIVVKTTLISLWLIREYYYFDFHCATRQMNKNTFELPNDEYFRLKRSILIPQLTAQFNGTRIHKRYSKSQEPEPLLDPRMKSKKGRKGKGRNVYPTTVVTLTNTQLLNVPDGEERIRMKTIRNRFEPVLPNTVELSLENETVEEIEDIDSEEESPPSIPFPPSHISRIVSRQSGELVSSTTDQSVLVEVAKESDGKKAKKKKKGKGRKKARLLEEQRRKEEEKRPTNGLPERNVTENGNSSEVPLFPPHRIPSKRHLFSVGVTVTTVRPHQSAFLGGAIDPKDPLFSNQGEIRGFKMHTASKRPPKKPKLKISEATRRMWELDEHNFTTLFPHENVHFENMSMNILSSNRISPSQPAFIDRITIPAVLGQATPETPKEEEEGTVIREMPRKYTVASTYPPMPEITRRPFREGAGDSFDSWKESVEGENGKGDIVVEVQTTIATTTNPLSDVIELSTEATSRVTIETRFGEELPNSQRMLKLNRPIKHGFDRSRDSDMERPVVVRTDSPRSNKEDERHFQDQLSRFTSSALCIARTLFDLWCIGQFLTAIPYMIGICFPKRIFFLVHLILDFTCLVITFIYSATILVFSLILYIFVGEMQQSTLLEWLVFSLVLDVIIAAYTAVVIVTVRCGEVLIDSVSPRKQVKILDPNSNELGLL